MKGVNFSVSLISMRSIQGWGWVSVDGWGWLMWCGVGGALSHSFRDELWGKGVQTVDPLGVLVRQQGDARLQRMAYHYPTYAEWFEELSDADKARTAALLAQFEAGKAHEAEEWVRSEIEEDIAQKRLPGAVVLSSYNSICTCVPSPKLIVTP